MNVTLPPDLESSINDAINAGRFSNPNEAIQEGMRVFFELEKYKTWKNTVQQKVNDGLDDLDKNGGIPNDLFEEELLEYINHK